jgi:hypothetical protein
MTRAPKDHEKPVRRIVQANGDDVVVEFTERVVTFRYPRSRKPVAESTWGRLLLRCLGESAK